MTDRFRRCNGDGVDTIPLCRHLAIISAVAAVALIVVLSLVTNAVITNENPEHAAGHLSNAVPLLLLAYVLTRVAPRPKPTRLGRLGRRALIIGMTMVGVSEVVEAIGAFGYQEAGDGVRFKSLQSIHNSSWILQFPGALVVLVGMLLAFLSLFQSRLPSRAAESGA